jgi:hypothetical protein
MLEPVANKVFKELEADGYEPRLHAHDDAAAFDIRLRGHNYDIDDLRAMIRTAEEFGLGLKLDENGWLTLH